MAKKKPEPPTMLDDEAKPTTPPDTSGIPNAPPPAPSGASNAMPPVEAPVIGKRDATQKPPTFVINAVEGFGKTTIGAFAPDPVIIMAQGETGYDTLLQYGRVPSVDAAMVNTWPELFATLDTLKKQKHRTVVLDALGGFVVLCHAYVCERDYKNDFGPKGFLSYNKGPSSAVRDWEMMLAHLAELHAMGKCIIILAHSLVKPFNDPMAEAYDRYILDGDKYITAATKKWADVVMFGKFKTIVDTGTDRSKNKGIGGTERILYTENADAYVAKNRIGMPSEIVLPNDHTKAWQTIRDNIGKGK